MRSMIIINDRPTLRLRISYVSELFPVQMELRFYWQIYIEHLQSGYPLYVQESPRKTSRSELTSNKLPWQRTGNTGTLLPRAPGQPSVSSQYIHRVPLHTVLVARSYGFIYMYIWMNFHIHTYFYVVDELGVFLASRLIPCWRKSRFNGRFPWRPSFQLLGGIKRTKTCNQG